MLLAILNETGSTLGDLLKDLPDQGDRVEEGRSIFAEEAGDAITIHFRYTKYDAIYTLKDATLDEFDIIIDTLRTGLSRLANVEESVYREAIKTDSVASAFLKAVGLWPLENPSDLWWFVIYRAYCDPFNHPAIFARLDFSQSWKRTSGWALEEVLVRHYSSTLERKGIKLFIADAATKRSLVEVLEVGERLEADKIDIVLTGGNNEQFFGVVHVKASFAERRTDDVPMSTALIRGGYTSPLWTMDCKSTPAKRPMNRGELGAAHGRISAKRMDIENEGYFSGCFSYNQNTHPSSSNLDPDRRVYVCDFRNPDDAFSRFIADRWELFQ